MMNDKEFFQLQLRATIVPQQVRWPAPEHLHWRRLHEAANEARERVSKAYTQMDEIDSNAQLSREEKHHRRCEVADQALAEFEASKMLMRAREAVRYGASPAMLKRYYVAKRPRLLGRVLISRQPNADLDAPPNVRYWG
jgi:hypothetical protein